MLLNFSTENHTPPPPEPFVEDNFSSILLLLFMMGRSEGNSPKKISLKKYY